MNILERIVEEKKREIASLPATSVAELRFAMERRLDRRDFMAALRHPAKGGMALIAEVKKASPSAGVICADFDPVSIARQYQEGGASCLSVLTDEKFFQGSLAYLKAIREAVSVPLLRKDFIIDERQILETVQAGADAILLIAAILTDEQLKRFIWLAGEARIAALVEVHHSAELHRALAASAKLLGVNNRDLKTFRVDLATTEELGAELQRSEIGKTVFLVAESGIRTRTDVERLERAGARAILVGETLMRGKEDIGGKIRELLGGRGE